MISVEDAEKCISQHVKVFQKVDRSIDQLDEEVVREVIRSDRPLPPFHRVAMDGIAININAWENGRRSFLVEGFQGAGDPPRTLGNDSGCIEIMTGSVLPEGCNCVIPLENYTMEGGYTLLPEEVPLKVMQNVHQEGSDRSLADPLVEEGARMFSPHWAIAASVGKGVLQVTHRPKIAIISTGNELVSVDSTPNAHQIRSSNSYAILSALRSCGYRDCDIYHSRDEETEMHDRLKEILNRYDVLILSGGVSVGKRDIVPQVLTSLGVKTIFHKVRQRPGKPFWFGTGEKNQLVFGLPGNPVSILVCLHRYVLSALRLASGRKTCVHDEQPYAVLDDEITFELPLTYFLPVKVTYSQDGRIHAHRVQTNGSGDFASLVDSDGFLELPESQGHFSGAFPLWFWNR